MNLIMSEKDDWKKEYDSSLNLSKDILNYFTVWDEEKGRAEVCEETSKQETAENEVHFLDTVPIKETVPEIKTDNPPMMLSSASAEKTPEIKKEDIKTRPDDGQITEKYNPREWIRNVRTELQTLQTDIWLLINVEPGDEDVWKATDDYINSKMQRIMAGTPIEKINFRKRGIRVSALRNAGYDFVSEIMGKSYGQLVSIEGIGEKSASLIIEERDVLWRELSNKVVYIPDRSDYTSVKPVLEFCRFSKLQGLYSEALQKYEAFLCQIENYLSLSKHTGALGWALLNRRNKQAIIEATEDIEKKRTPINEKEIHQLADRKRCIENECQSEIKKNFNEWSKFYVNYIESKQTRKTIRHKRQVKNKNKVKTIERSYTENQSQKTFLVILIVFIFFLIIAAIK